MNVYDFDNTIYDGESILDFFFFYLKKTPYLVKYIPKVFYALYKYKRSRSMPPSLRIISRTSRISRPTS